ncbi:hypothetical protein HMPREF9418_0003 [Neisseria macacae ATCC 33926]|uniref:Uncharacterized protein n=1 Tax=Neisseria macacae ATCC 33926 TaxID=997348 RepID=A0AA36UM15_9NEIS|nr:hypothetical protein HMPREF9418_0003 [Neisseria macacae ATCC 33926]
MKKYKGSSENLSLMSSPTQGNCCSVGFARENPNTEIVDWVGFTNPTCPC